MKEELLVAGFGGQGVLSLGMVVTYAGMLEGKEVSWMPSYGPEMRGGTANCIAILSDDSISSPIISRFDSAIFLNQPSLDKFESRIKPGGLLLYESHNVVTPPTRNDITLQAVPAAEEAARLENNRVMNMVMLGAFLAHKPLLNPTSILNGIESVLPAAYHDLLPLNEAALKRGMAVCDENGWVDGDTDLAADAAPAR